MWSTNPIFLPFPKHFRFRSLKILEGHIVEVLDSSFHPSGVGPQLPRAMPPSSLRTSYELKDSFMSFPFQLSIILSYDLYVVLLG